MARRRTRPIADADQGASTGTDDGAPAHAELTPLLLSPLPMWKRAMDVVASSVALLVLSPLLLLIAAAIRLTSPGPAFFVQRRHGWGGRTFPIIKFRTMVPDAEAMKQGLRSHNEVDGPVFKIKRDPRVTRVGAVLRSTSLDELPQLVNVLLGEMTLVGPRPLPVDESEACHPWQHRRLSVTPGITCLWQTQGRSMMSFDDWVRLDLAYAAGRSPRLDLRIILATVPAVIRRKGAW